MVAEPKKRVVLSDAELLDYSATHLHYEVWMLFCARGLMLSREKAFKAASEVMEAEDRRVELNAAVESFALHVRTLILFLDPDRVLPDDVTAKDFLDSLSDWSPEEGGFAEARKRANKQVAHLTKLRIDGYHPDKEWDPKLADQIAAALQDFAAKASPKKLAAKFRGLLDSVTPVRHED